MEHRTIRYRLKPQTRSKAKMLHWHCGATRFVWNHFVSVLRDEYIYYGKVNSHKYSLFKRFTNLKYYHPWLRELSNGNVREVLSKLHTTYQNFYKDKSNGLPKFKSRWGKHSFLLVGGCFKIEDNSIFIAKIGWMTIRGNNPYHDGKAVSGTVKRECGKWYVYITYKVEVAEHKESHEVSVVGIDRNVGQVATTNGEIIPLPDVERLEKRKKRYQRMMARRQRGSRKQKVNPSNRYLKAKLLCQKTHKKIVQKRTNWCHQVSRELANTHDVIVLEDLNTKGMTRAVKGEGHKAKAGLNRGISNSAWGKLEQCLGYKSKVVKINPRRTSQICRECGYTAKENRVSQSQFRCGHCEHEANADINAALNIRALGIGVIGRGKAGQRVVADSVERQNDFQNRGYPLCTEVYTSL